MEKKKKSNTIFTLVFLVLGILIWYFFVNMPYHDNAIKVEYNTEISGIISYATNNRGDISLRLKRPKEVKYYLTPTRNYEYNPYSFHEFVQGEDSVYKPAYSDTIYIFRRGKRYYFIINKMINYRE